MDKATACVDRILTIILQALVLAMVFCVSAEIVLNAFVQPAAVWAIRQSPDGQVSSDEHVPAVSLYRRVLKAMTICIGRISAPINVASQTLLVWIGILGSSLAFRNRAHLGVDALVRLYPPRVRLWLDLFATALAGLFSLTVLLAGGTLLAYNAFSRGYRMPGMESMNRGWFYLVLALAGALNIFYAIYHLRHPQPVGQYAPISGENAP